MAREAAISGSAEPAIPARKARTGPDQPSRPGRPRSVEPAVRKRTIRSADRSGRPRRLNRGPSKCGKFIAEVPKTWIPRYRKTAEHIRESRDFELRETGQNLDFEVHQNRGIRWWGVANSESGESPKIRHFRTIERWNLVREAPVSSSAEPAIPTRNARIGRTGSPETDLPIRG